MNWERFVMKKHFFFLVLTGLFLFWGPFGCSRSDGFTKTVVPIEDEDITVSPEIQITETKDKEIAQSSSLVTTPTKQLLQSSQCTNISSTPILGNGERLLFLDRSENESRFLAVDDYSGKTDVILTVETVQKNILLSSNIVSRDGEQIAYISRSLNSKELVIYTLKSGDSARFLLPNNTEILALNGWTAGGQVVVTTKWDYQYDRGISYTYILVDPREGKTETQQGLYSLPGINYDPDYPIFDSNIPSIDLLQERALYYKQVGPATPKATLIELISKKILWENDKGYNGEPAWAADGSRVVFASFYGSDPYLKILSLSKEGFVSELTHQRLFDFDYIFRYFKLSLDNRYIHYAFWHTIGAGPGYVLDTSDEQVWEICGYSGEFLYGWWIDKHNYLVYETQEGEESEFWVLDLQNWQTRKLISGKNIT